MIVRATAGNQNQLRFTAEHQPALAQRRRVGRREWAVQFSDTAGTVGQIAGYIYQALFTKYAKDKKIKDERKTERTYTLRSDTDLEPTFHCFGKQENYKAS